MTRADLIPVTITRQKMASRGPGPAWYWHYYAVAPDGRRFDNRRIDDLRYAMKRYGFRPVRPWKGESS